MAMRVVGDELIFERVYAPDIANHDYLAPVKQSYDLFLKRIMEEFVPFCNECFKATMREDEAYIQIRNPRLTDQLSKAQKDIKSVNYRYKPLTVEVYLVRDGVSEQLIDKDYALVRLPDLNDDGTLNFFGKRKTVGFRIINPIGVSYNKSVIDVSLSRSKFTLRYKKSNNVLGQYVVGTKKKSHRLLPWLHSYSKELEKVLGVPLNEISREYSVYFNPEAKYPGDKPNITGEYFNSVDVSRLRGELNKVLSFDMFIGRKLARDAVNTSKLIVASAGEEITKELVTKLNRAGVALIYVQGLNKDLMQDRYAVTEFVKFTLTEDMFFRGKRYNKGYFMILAPGATEDLSSEEMKILIDAGLTEFAGMRFESPAISNLGYAGKHLTPLDMLSMFSFYVNPFRDVSVDRDKEFIKYLGGFETLLYETLEDTVRELTGTAKNKGLRAWIKDLLDSSGGMFTNRDPLRGITEQWKHKLGKLKLLQEPSFTNPAALLSSVMKTEYDSRGMARMPDEVKLISMQHKGRLCPYNSPASGRVGEVTTPTIAAKIDPKTLKVLTPLYEVEFEGRRAKLNYSKVVWVTPEEELDLKICDIIEFNPDENGYSRHDSSDYIKAKIPVIPEAENGSRTDIEDIPVSMLTHCECLPSQLLSPQAAMIPFIGMDDGVRTQYGIALMKQAVPIEGMERPRVYTQVYKHITKHGEYGRVAEKSGTFHFTPTVGSIGPYGRENISMSYVISDADDEQEVSVTSERRAVKSAPKKNLFEKLQLARLQKERDTQADEMAAKRKADSKFIKGTEFVADTYTAAYPLANRKQVRKGEQIITSNWERDGIYSFGVNTLVIVAHDDGYNYEDSISISESYADKLISYEEHRHSITIPRYNKEGKELKKRNLYVVGDMKSAPFKSFRKGDVFIKRVTEDTIGMAVQSGDQISEARMKEIEMEVNKYMLNLMQNYTKEKNTADYFQKAIEKRQELIAKEKERVSEAIADKEKSKSKGSRDLIADKDLGYLVKIQDYYNEESRSDVKELQFVKRNETTRADKVSDRHGSKATISRIISDEDMFKFANGVSADMIINPCGIVSRMNIGKKAEGYLGFICYLLDIYVCMDSFNGATMADISLLMKFVWSLANNGKDIEEAIKITKADSRFASVPVELYDAALRSGDRLRAWKGSFNDDGTAYIFMPETQTFMENPVAFGMPYYFKVMHMAEHKSAVRGNKDIPYTSLFNQPTHGSRNRGGQKIGEMENVTLLAHGCMEVVREMLNDKSDNRKNQKANGLVGYKDAATRVPTATARLYQIMRAVGVDLEGLPSSRKKDLSKSSSDGDFEIKNMMAFRDMGL